MAEVLDERVDSSRGTRQPRGVRRRISQYPARASGGCQREKIDDTPQVLNGPHSKTAETDF